MKIFQKIPVWILIIIVCVGGIIGAVKTSAEDVRALTYDVETMKGSVDVLQGMSLEVELYDFGSVYFYDTFKNETSIWNSTIPLTDAAQSVTEYEWGEREQEKKAYLSLYCGSIVDIWDRMQQDIGDEGGTYYLKDYMKRLPVEVRITGEGYRGKVDESTLPIHCPVTDEMCLIVGPKGKTYGNVSESREVSSKGFPRIQSQIPLLFWQNRVFFTISEFQWEAEGFEGTSGIMELHKDGKIEVLYPMVHHKDAEEKIVDLSMIGNGKLVLFTEKNHTLLAYCYDIETGKMSDGITLWENMPDKMIDFRMLFSLQGNYLNFKIQYEDEMEIEQYCYRTLLLQNETLECVFSATNIQSPIGDIQVIHDQKYKEVESILYFKDGVLYETYATSYVINQAGEICSDFYGYRDQFYKKGIMLCAFDETGMIYYGMLKGVHETIDRQYLNQSNFWKVSRLQWR